MQVLDSTVKEATQTREARENRRARNSLRNIRKHGWFLIMLIPAFLFYFVFRYVPMFGIVIAFKDYNPFIGVFESEWVGLRWFVEMFRKPDFWPVLRNTIVISFQMLLFGFPAPIILAILINELRAGTYKRVIQTITYLPHFLSWAVIGGLAVSMLSPSTGIINHIVRSLGGTPEYFIINPNLIRPIMVVTNIWKEIGWGSIIYIAVIATINQELYESAIIDGAGWVRQTWSITLPGMMSIIVLNLVFASSNLIQVGFDMVYNLVTPPTYSTGEVLATYVYRLGIGRFQYSFTTAVGLAQSVVGLLLLILANVMARHFYEEGAVW